MIDNLIDRPRRQQRTPLALMSRLTALPAPRRILLALGRATRRIRARRLRTVARTTTQPPLVLLRQRQQHRDDRITTLLIDRLRLDALHASYFDTAQLCPPTN